MEIVVNLPYFREEIIVKEGPIKIGEELGKADQKNSMAVNRPFDRTQQRRNMAQIFDMQQALLTGLSVAAQDCQQPEVQN